MEFAFSVETLIALLTVIAIDLVLSGDNAIVIAMATRRLPDHQRNKAIYWGTGFAIILRIFFAIIIALLLKIPLVHFFGGLLLLFIAYKVLVDNHGDESHNVKSKDSMTGAIGTIIMADAVMSLDNVVAVAGASHGNIFILALGVLISIPIMIFGSKIIVRYMTRFPWIAYLGSGILAWTAGEMIIGDEKIMHWLNISEGPITYIFTAVVTVLTLFLAYSKNKKSGNAASLGTE